MQWRNAGLSPAWHVECVTEWHPDDAGFAKGGICAGMRERCVLVACPRPPAVAGPALPPTGGTPSWRADSEAGRPLADTFMGSLVAPAGVPSSIGAPRPMHAAQPPS